MVQNMLVKGHVERWVSITDIGNMSIKDVPVTSFKYVLEEMGTNYIDRSSMSIVVGLSWVQNFFARIL
jgi:hypothetical protein